MGGLFSEKAAAVLQHRLLLHLHHLHHHLLLLLSAGQGSAVTYRIVEEDVGCRLQVHTRQISPRVTEWVPSDPTDEVEEGVPSLASNHRPWGFHRGDPSTGGFHSTLQGCPAQCARGAACNL